MSATANLNDYKQNAVEVDDAEKDAPAPQIHVEEKRLKLDDYLKTLVKVNGSDLHLQADSVPMIRVDGKARFLDCPKPDNALMTEYVKTIVKSQEDWERLENKGALAHEFRLATVKDNDEHAAMMREMPDMKHDEANTVSIAPGKNTEILWRFTQTGTFEFACLIPGHREAGMHGTVAVK